MPVAGTNKYGAEVFAFCHDSTAVRRSKKMLDRFNANDTTSKVRSHESSAFLDTDLSIFPRTFSFVRCLRKPLARPSFYHSYSGLCFLSFQTARRDLRPPTKAELSWITNLTLFTRLRLRNRERMCSWRRCARSSKSSQGAHQQRCLVSIFTTPLVSSSTAPSTATNSRNWSAVFFVTNPIAQFGIFPL